jgi:hypothetical protein
VANAGGASATAARDAMTHARTTERDDEARDPRVGPPAAGAGRSSALCGGSAICGNPYLRARWKSLPRFQQSRVCITDPDSPVEKATAFVFVLAIWRNR